jgi:hypothetical protein
MGTRQDPILVVTPVDRTAGPATPGMDRQQAVATEGTWAGFVRTEAGMVSGWHHHGEYETVIYVLSGALMMEFGPNGSNRRGRPRRLRLRSERGGAPGEQPLHGCRPTSSLCEPAAGNRRSTSAGHPHPDRSSTMAAWQGDSADSCGRSGGLRCRAVRSLFAVRASEAHDLRDVVRVRRQSDHGGSLVDHQVERRLLQAIPPRP